MLPCWLGAFCGRRPSVSSCLSAPDRSRELGSSQACGLGSLFSFLHLCLPRSLHLLAAFPAAPSPSSPAFPPLLLCAPPCVGLNTSLAPGGVSQCGGVPGKAQA